MDRPQAGGYNIYEIALSLRKTDVVSVTRVSNCGPQRMSLLTRFGRVFAKFFQKPQQCQPFVFRKISPAGVASPFVAAGDADDVKR